MNLHDDEVDVYRCKKCTVPESDYKGHSCGDWPAATPLGVLAAKPEPEVAVCICGSKIGKCGTMEEIGLSKDAAIPARPVFVAGVRDLDKICPGCEVPPDKYDGHDCSEYPVEGFKLDDKKTDLTLVPASLVPAVARIMQQALEKYPRENWRKVDNVGRRYTAALLRHITAYLAGEDLDPDSGQPHLDHAASCIALLIAMRDEHHVAIGDWRAIIPEVTQTPKGEN